MKRELEPALAQRRNHNLIQTRAEQRNGRTAATDGAGNDPGQEQCGYQHVLPAVEGPLMRPPNRPFASKWAKIMNYPQIVASRTASANQVAEEVQMEGNENKQQGSEAKHTGQTGDGDDQQRSEEAVQDEMMVNEKVVGRFTAKELIGEIHSHAKPVQIRREAGQANPKPLPAILGASFGQRPTREKMSNRAHPALSSETTKLLSFQLKHPT